MQHSATENSPVNQEFKPQKSVIIDMTVNTLLKTKIATEKIAKGLQISKTQMAVKDLFMVNMSRRLAQRKLFHNRLSVTADMMCVISIVGILLMITANEITFQHHTEYETLGSWFIKLIISISTVILLLLVLVYHRLDLALYSVNNSIDDWRVGLTCRKILIIVSELVICAVHPMLRLYPTDSRLVEVEARVNASEITSYDYTHVSTDVALGLPMFIRLYLLFRCVMYHSHLIRNSATQSLGYLNQVSMDFSFFVRAYIDRWPARCLLSFCVLSLFVGSWSLRACSYEANNDHLSMPDAMWLFSITFTTVGYGDLYPSTYCGRTVAVMVSLFGIIASALLIAVLSQKLLLDRSEKYVHGFVINTELTKKHQIQAANVIKYALILWILRRKEKSRSARYLRIQQKLFGSIGGIQELKDVKKRTTESCIDQTEIFTMQRNANEKTEVINFEMSTLKTNVSKIEEQLVEVQHTMNNIQNTLNILIDTIAPRMHL